VLQFFVTVYSIICALSFVIGVELISIQISRRQEEKRNKAKKRKNRDVDYPNASGEIKRSWRAMLLVCAL